MEAVVIILAIIGLLALIALAVAALNGEPSPPEPDLAAPYREGLHAAIRLQRTAQDLEQQIYAEAQATQRHDAESTAAPGESE